MTDAGTTADMMTDVRDSVNARMDVKTLADTTTDAGMTANTVKGKVPAGTATVRSEHLAKDLRDQRSSYPMTLRNCCSKEWISNRRESIPKLCCSSSTVQFS